MQNRVVPYEYKKVPVNGILAQALKNQDAVTQFRVRLIINMYAEAKWPFDCASNNNDLIPMRGT